MSAGSEFEALWSDGIEDELAFWRDFLATEGGHWPDGYQFRMDPDAPLQLHLVELLPDCPRVSILDVGAGPLTMLGKVWPGHEVDIQAVDALATQYDQLFVEADVKPPVQTRQCHSERLTATFEPDSFDLVCAVNTLDHSYDPMTAIRQMVTLGRVVYLQHHPNEAEFEAYNGLHQWNFDVVDGSCVLWRPGERFDLDQELPGTDVTGTKWTGRDHDDNMTFMTIRRTAVADGA